MGPPAEPRESHDRPFAPLPGPEVEAMARREARLAAVTVSLQQPRRRSIHACGSASTMISADQLPARGIGCATMSERESPMKRSIALALCGLLLAPLAAAQEWPAKSVRIIVPFAPGPTPDIARPLIRHPIQHNPRPPSP